MPQGARCPLKILAGLLHPRQPLGQLKMSQAGQSGRELPPAGSLQDSVQSPGHDAVAMDSHFRLLPTEQDVWARPTSAGVNPAALRRYRCLFDTRILGKEAWCALKHGCHLEIHQVGAVQFCSCL